MNRAEYWSPNTLRGIGNVLTETIVDYRSKSGPFRTIKGLLKVSGTGSATSEQIRDYITLSAREAFQIRLPSSAKHH